MADNVTVDNGALTDYVAATDDDGTAHHQYVKVEFGGDGTFTKVTSAVGLPVSDAGGSLTVDAPVATPVFVRLSDGTAAIATLPVSAAALPLPSGAATSAKQDTIIGHVDGIEASLTTVAGAVAGAEMQVDVITSALPTGAATAAKQPALGTAGTSSADVITVQGRAAMTPILIDGSATTQPVSHGALTELAAAINASALDVNIVGGSSSGTQYTEADTDATITGTAVMWEDASDTLRAVSAAKPLPVNIISGAGSGGTAIVDDAAFTPGTTSVTPIGGILDDTAPDSVDEGDAGAVRMSANRSLHVRVRDNAGNERGLNIDANGAIAATVTNATAANLNVTEASAAAIAASASVLDDWDESDRAKVNPIAGQAGVAAGAGAVSALTQRVVIATDQTVIPVSDNGSSLTVDGTVAVTNADLTTIAGAVRAEDAASADGHTGIVNLAVRKATPANTSGTDGDYEMLQMSAGRVWVSATVDAALPAGTNNIGDVDVLSIAAGDNNIGNVDIVTMPNVTLAAGTNTNEIVGDVAQDAVIAGNPVSVGGRASSAVPTAMSANGDSVYQWLDLSGATVVTGYVAQDAAVAGNPVLNGARASTAVPTAMSTDGDSVHLWADLNGSLVVRPRIKQLDIAVTPTIDTAVYASGDRLGSVMTFAGAALVSGGTGTIVKAVLHDEAASNFEIWLHLFKVSPTLVNADNGVLDITDANAAIAIYVATIKFPTTETIAFSTSIRFVQGLWLGGPPAIGYETSGSTSLFGVLEARGAYDAAVADDLIVTLTVIRD